MPSAFSHAAAALSLGTPFYRELVPKRVWVLGAICAALPDLDVIGFRFGIHYADFWGHRGFTHSLCFAAILAGGCVALTSHSAEQGLTRSRLWFYLFLATASHGVFDAMTDGGLGVAFFAPFDNSRYFLPWTPISVSPISIRRFFTLRGLLVFKSELLWVWVPSAIFAGLILIFRAARQKKKLNAQP